MIHSRTIITMSAEVSEGLSAVASDLAYEQGERLGMSDKTNDSEDVSDEGEEEEEDDEDGEEVKRKPEYIVDNGQAYNAQFYELRSPRQREVKQFKFLNRTLAKAPTFQRTQRKAQDENLLPNFRIDDFITPASLHSSDWKELGVEANKLATAKRQESVIVPGMPESAGVEEVEVAPECSEPPADYSQLTHSSGSVRLEGEDDIALIASKSKQEKSISSSTLSQSEGGLLHNVEDANSTSGLEGTLVDLQNFTQSRASRDCGPEQILETSDTSMSEVFLRVGSSRSLDNPKAIKKIKSAFGRARPGKVGKSSGISVEVTGLEETEQKTGMDESGRSKPHLAGLLKKGGRRDSKLTSKCGSQESAGLPKTKTVKWDSATDASGDIFYFNGKSGSNITTVEKSDSKSHIGLSDVEIVEEFDLLMSSSTNVSLKKDKSLSRSGHSTGKRANSTLSRSSLSMKRDGHLEQHTSRRSSLSTKGDLASSGSSVRRISLTMGRESGAEDFGASGLNLWSELNEDDDFDFSFRKKSIFRRSSSMSAKKTPSFLPRKKGVINLESAGEEKSKNLKNVFQAKKEEKKLLREKVDATKYKRDTHVMSSQPL